MNEYIPFHPPIILQGRIAPASVVHCSIRPSALTFDANCAQSRHPFSFFKPKKSLLDWRVPQTFFFFFWLTSSSSLFLFLTHKVSFYLVFFSTKYSTHVYKRYRWIQLHGHFPIGWTFWPGHLSCMSAYESYHHRHWQYSYWWWKILFALALGV